MENIETGTHKAHCLILPYPLQGHINPMLQFSKRLQSKGVKVTVAATNFILKTMQELSSSVSVEAISDGHDESGRDLTGNFTAYITKFKEVGSKTLSQLIEKLSVSGCPVNCIVYDPFLSWAVDVAQEHGLTTACFFTQSCAVDCIYYHVHKGLMKLPIVEIEVLSSVSGLPTMEILDLPTFLRDNKDSPSIVEMMVNQFSSVERADWILINSFYELEKEVTDWLAKLYQVKTIGPTIPSMCLDKRLQDDKEYGLSVFKPMTNTCLNWLNHQPLNSVVYVSFGSLAKLEAEQMQELAWGLRNSNKNFLWVVRSSEEDKLPKKFAKELEASGKGLVVSWCPQLEVLAHKSIGCFLTHCGWNSTLEALSSGVPMVAMPQWSDQPTNAKLVEAVWEVGVRAKPDEKGIVRQEVVKECIRQVLDEERGETIRVNANKWKQLARNAVDEGGSSDGNIQEFVSKLVSIAS